MDYVTPGSLGALLVHLVKPPQTENDTPENVISPGWGQREQGFGMGIRLCLKRKEKQKSALTGNGGGVHLLEAGCQAVS